MSRRESNRLAQAATAVPDITVELGTLPMRELRTVVEALHGQARAYGRHPRSAVAIAIASKLIERGLAAEEAYLEDEAQR